MCVCVCMCVSVSATSPLPFGSDGKMPLKKLSTDERIPRAKHVIFHILVGFSSHNSPIADFAFSTLLLMPSGSNVRESVCKLLQMPLEKDFDS